MSRLVAPTALRSPISRVRSVTETSMMFIIPTPPTKSEMAAMAARKSVKTLVMVPSRAAKSAWVSTKKSSLSGLEMPCEFLSVILTS